MADERQDLVDFIYECPRDIAVKFGYDKLTDLHNWWIKDMVFGKGDHTLQAHRGSFKTTCLVIAFAFIIVLFPGDRTIFMRKTDADVAEVLAATASVLKTGTFRAIVRRLYGVDLVITKETQSEVSTNLRQGVSGASQLVGLGCGGSITGKHADRVFTDDIVNVKDRVSAAERERIKLIYQECRTPRTGAGQDLQHGHPVAQGRRLHPHARHRALGLLQHRADLARGACRHRGVHERVAVRGQLQAEAHRRRGGHVLRARVLLPTPPSCGTA